MIKFVMTIFLMKSNFVMTSYYGSEDQRSSLIITTDDHKLVGQTIHKRKATDVFDCALCLIGDQCKSFNFNEESGDCYLNGRRAKDKELVHAYGFIYGEKTQNPCEAKPCQNGGECSVDDNKQGYQCKCKTGFKGKNCQATCNIPVGMESGKIPDSSITASSQYSINYNPAHARLNNKDRCWTAKYPSSKGEWLQVDLGKVYTITGIATQGDPRLIEWVKNYKMRYDNTTINSASPFAESGKNITGNKDNNSIVKHTFNPSFDARYVRVLPQEWKKRISLRIEIYVGC